MSSGSLRKLASLLLALTLSAAQARSAEKESHLPFLTGVNLASATFGPEIQPGRDRGRHDREYVYPLSTPAYQGHAAFLAAGMNSFRIGFLWERIQPTLDGPLDDAELARLLNTVDKLLEAGAWVILDVHNYARYEQKIIGTPDVPATAFADLWGKLATRFKDRKRVILGLMNEPYGIAAKTWVDAANKAIVAIRNAGARQLILVPGINYSSTRHWLDDGNAAQLARIHDPLDYVAFDAHIYLNSTATGQEADCVNETIGIERMKPFVQWLKQTKRFGFLGEFGGGTDRACLDALSNMADYMLANRDVFLGWSYWAGGPWWPADYFTSIEPRPDGSPAPQMQALVQHLKAVPSRMRMLD